MSAKKSDTSHRTSIIQVILDRYENNTADWRTYGTPESHGNRSFPVNDELYEELGKRELCQEVTELQREKVLQHPGKLGGWQMHGAELERIHYGLEQIPELYRRDGRRPKLMIINEALEELDSILQGEMKPWIRSCFLALRDAVNNGKIPAIYQKKEIYFKTLLALNELQQPLFKRIFSKKVLGDSKLFEREIEKRIITDARKYHEDVEEDENVMGKDEVLAQLYIETYHQELALKGPLRFQLGDKIIDTSAFLYGVNLNARTLSEAKILPDQSIERIISVENKANYEAMDRQDNTLILYTHGFFTPKEREFLKRLHEVLKESQVEYYHSSDLDLGGLRIYENIKKNIFPGLVPYQMDAVQFHSYEQYGADCEKSYLDKVRQMEVPLELQELKDCILETGKVIEQEAFIVNV